MQFIYAQKAKVGYRVMSNVLSIPMAGWEILKTKLNAPNKTMNTIHSDITKNTGLNVNWTICTFLIAAAFFVTGCGHKVSGIYKPVNDASIIRALNFTSDGKVETSSALGTETDTYVVEGNQVKIKDGNDVTVFTIDKDGSLDGESGLGRFVKQ